MNKIRFLNSYSKLQEDFDRLEFDFESNYMDDTYLMNNINVFISSFNLKENKVVIKSLDERPIVHNLTTLTITVYEFLDIVK